MSVQTVASPSVVVPPALGGLPELQAARPQHRSTSWAASFAYRAAAAVGLHGVRLTRRGKVVFVSGFALLAVAVLAFLVVTTVALGASKAGASTEPRPGASSVVVGDGDTLWSIAERIRPQDDPRRTVEEIVRVNQLPSPRLAPGQVLELPGV